MGARDGGGVEFGEEPGAGPDHGALPDHHGGLDQLDGAPGPDGLHRDLELLQGDQAEYVEADPGQRQSDAGVAGRSVAGVTAVGAVLVDGVDDQAAERAEVLLVGVPGALGLGGGLVAVLAGALVVALVVAVGRGGGGGHVRFSSGGSLGAGRAPPGYDGARPRRSGS
ncbi:hypothetical protein GCM10018790_76420 [Kitasatospora xanthocidica]|nr:hypothetical protein GCM10018790_76420 [Kitasatospora xanthocidica]